MTQKHRLWTEGEDDNLLKDYPDLSISKEELEFIYKRNYPAIKVRANSLGAFRQRVGAVSTSKYSLLMSKEEIKQAYLSGSSSNEIALRCSCSSANITTLLKRMGVKLRTQDAAQRKYELDIKVFDKLDANGAYFLGLLYADGCNLESRGEVVISLHKQDLDILESFNRFLKSNKPLQELLPKNQLRLSICSRHISQKLTELGCVARKSHETTFPELCPSLQHHFIRGLFDGDGGLSKSKTIKSNVGFNLTGNFELINSVQEKLVKNCNLKATKLDVRHTTTPNIVTLRYSGRGNLSRIFNYLYKEGDVYGVRKYSFFREIV